MIQDVDKLTDEELIVRDKRRVYDADREVVTPVQEGAAVPAVDEPTIAVPAESVEIVEPTPAPKPITAKDYPTMHVPSLLGGTIQYRVGELFPWKGVFFLVADVKNEPVPHMIITPVDHTGAHKKTAKSKKFGRG